jgi:hypothetical protein
MKMKFRTPFDLFGGAIFKQMEQAQLAVVAHHLEEKQSLPKEFDPFCDLESQVDFPRHWSKFQHRHKSGAILYGEPDDICQFSDGTLAVIDHKTANPKNGDDPLFPMYQVQVTGYGYIAEYGLKLGTVSKAGLFYWSADHISAVEDPGKAYKNGRLAMQFVPKPHPIDIDYGLLDKPLKEVARIWKLSTPPDGANQCSDCKKLDALFALDAEAGESTNKQDRLRISASGNKSWVRSQVYSKEFKRSQGRLAALAEIRDEVIEDGFSPYGVALNWEDFNEIHAPDLDALSR